ncbi:MAG TPA: serine/threonine-protein kinase [Drouetiella sp.]
MSYRDRACLPETVDSATIVEQIILLEESSTDNTFASDLCRICGQMMLDEDMHACLQSLPASFLTLQDPRLGTVVADDFVLEEYICTSDTSYVYKARHQLLNTHVAVKISNGVAEPDPFSVLRTNRAALIAMRLDHPNIVRTLKFNRESSENAVLIMEWAHGIALSQLISKEAPLMPLRAVNLIEGVCDALRYAHTQGVNHINLKPNGILVHTANNAEQARLLDFGLMKMIGPHTPEATCNSHHFRYASPEEVAGQPPDQRSTIYTVGLILYEMLTGCLEEQELVGGSTKKREFPALVKVCPQMKEAVVLDPIISRCLETKAARRYQTMEDLGFAFADAKMELERIHRAELILSRQLHPDDERMNKVWMILAMVAAIIMLALFTAHGSLPVK